MTKPVGERRPEQVYRDRDEFGAWAIEQSEITLSPEVANWAGPELERALSGWERYNLPGLPASATEVMEAERGKEALTYLYQARKAIIDSDYMPSATGDKEAAADTMHLVLVPWQLMKDNVDRLDSWGSDLREIEGVATESDFYRMPRDYEYKDGSLLYHNPAVLSAERGSETAELLSLERYLEDRIAENGPWGVILAQFHDVLGAAGVDSKLHISSEDIMNKDRSPYEISGYRVDGMGIIEWLSMTAQRGLWELLRDRNDSYLPANYVLDSDGEPRMLYGTLIDDDMRVRVYVTLMYPNPAEPRPAEPRLVHSRPRLAVVPSLMQTGLTDQVKTPQPWQSAEPGVSQVRGTNPLKHLVKRILG